MFRNLNELVEAARAKGPVPVAVAAGRDPDAIEALRRAGELGLAEGIFIEDPDDAAACRKAVALVREGKARLLMKGKVGTSTLVKAVLDREAGLRTGGLLSQVIVFQVPGFDRLMLMSDAAINIAPNVAQKAGICRNAIGVAHAIGMAHPNVALLCALEYVNPEMPATVDAAALTRMNRGGELAGGYLEGPVALDVPLSRFAAGRKGISSPIVENTDIFIAPDIEAANILYRAILYFARAESGGIVVGAKAPLILLSRAETPETKIRSIALGILAGGARAG